MDDDGCRTPDLDRGRCILVKHCQNMVTFLKMAPSPLPPPIKEMLREYICGHNEGQVKVCCPDKPIPPIASKLLMADEPEKMESVENHKNLELLPMDCGYMETTDKISNGQNAGLREFPWMALLMYNTCK